MQTESQQIMSQDGLKLHCATWQIENPTGVICLIHGHGEHTGRYEHVASYFNEIGFSVFGMDLRGHGLSEGKRGHTPSYEYLLNDTEEFLKLARSEYTELPIILMGHSMGGNIVLNYILRKNINELKGFIASSPYLKLAFDPPKWKVKLGKTMAQIIPGLSQPTGLNPDHLSKDSAVVRAYIDDPLVHNKMSAKMFVEFTNASDYALSHAGDVKLPGLIYHGNQDKIIAVAGSIEFADKTGNKIQLITYEEVFHEPHNDLEKKEVLGNIGKWIKQYST